MSAHIRQTQNTGVHTIVAWTFTDATTLASFTPLSGVPRDASGLVSADLYRVGLALDSNSLYILISIDPVEWQALGGGGGGSVDSVSGTAPIVSSGGTTPAISITAATESAPGSMSAVDKTSIDAWTASQRGTFTQVSASFASGTSQPKTVSDATMTGLSAGGNAVGASSGTLGVISGSFASSGAETGTGSGQGGLGSAAASGQPYNSTDFPGGLYAGLFENSNQSAVLLRQMLSTAVLDLDAEVLPVFAYRSDVSANNKWRVWWYYLRAADGLWAPFTPDTSVTGILYAPQVVLRSVEPASAGFTNGVAGQGVLELIAGVVGDLVGVDGSAATIGKTGRYMDAGTKLQLTFAALNAILAAASSEVDFNSQKLGGVADPTTAQQVVTVHYAGLVVRDWAGPWGNTQNPGNTTQRYLTLGNVGTTTPATTLTNQAAVAPAPGVIRQWNVAQSSSISTDSLTYTIWINGVATGASIVVAGGSTTGSQSGISYSFNEGDLVAIGIQQSSTQAAANIYMGAAIGVSKS